MHVCVYVFMYVCMCVYVCVCMCGVCVCMYVYVCMYMYVCACVHVYACVHVCVCMYVCMNFVSLFSCFPYAAMYAIPCFAISFSNNSTFHVGKLITVHSLFNVFMAEFRNVANNNNSNSTFL